VGDDRRPRVETARIDRVDDAHVAPGLRETRGTSRLLVAAAGEHDVPDRTWAQAAHRFDHTRTHRRGLRIDNERALRSDLHGAIAAGPDKYMNLTLRGEHMEITLCVDRRSGDTKRSNGEGDCRTRPENVLHRLMFSAATRAR
jgi:hypothetical protein